MSSSSTRSGARCWAAIVPVPVAIGISDEHRHKLLRIARKLGQPFVYSDRKTLERVGQFATQSGESVEAATYAALQARAFLVDDLKDISRKGVPHAAQPGDTAFIQFSSGSTSDPKGVVLTHANLIANWIGSTQMGGFNENDVSLSWMPLTHDMGLIGFHLIMFANRVHMNLMSTELFVRRPLLWLQIAAQQHATILCSPNFGYRHFLKVLGDRSPGNLDLSNVRLIFNGAEPISVELCEEFLARLHGLGLRRNAMYPVYGLAEASLAVSFPPVGRPPAHRPAQPAQGGYWRSGRSPAPGQPRCTGPGQRSKPFRCANCASRTMTTSRWQMATWVTSTFVART